MLFGELYQCHKFKTTQLRSDRLVVDVIIVQFLFNNSSQLESCDWYVKSSLKSCSRSMYSFIVQLTVSSIHNKSPYTHSPIYAPGGDLCSGLTSVSREAGCSSFSSDSDPVSSNSASSKYSDGV